MPASRRKQAVLSSSEQAALLRQPNQKAPTGLRNLCLLMLMLKAGLRSGEVLNLGSDDIDWNNGTIYVAQSGAAKERTLWLDQELLAVLEQWRRIRPTGSPYFFTTLKGDRIKDRYLREMVKRLSRKAEIAKDVHPHVLRSTFAVNLIRETNDIRLAQNALGHRDISTTQAYVKHLFREHSMTYYDLLGYRRSGVPAESTSIPKNPHYHGGGAIQGSKEDNQKENKGVNEEVNEGKIITGEHNSFTEKETIRKEERREEAITKEPEGKLKNIEIKPIERKPIPALKCSGCSYILRYREDCPKCGASFASILEHWRKNV